MVDLPLKKAPGQPVLPGGEMLTRLPIIPIMNTEVPSKSLTTCADSACGGGEAEEP
jgi:hypothetical protein